MTQRTENLFLMKRNRRTDNDQIRLVNSIKRFQIVIQGNSFPAHPIIICSCPGIGIDDAN